MLLALILFGSRARGDHRQTSDIDLLGVIERGSIKSDAFSQGANVHSYPIEFLRAKSASGDLFLLHLISEGKILHDTAGLFSDVCDKFRYKSSYDQELREASSIVWFLSDHPEFLQNIDARNRLIWGLRTILIARSAEDRVPRFSASALADFSNISELKFIIEKRSNLPSKMLIDMTVRVASSFGISRQELAWPKTLKLQQSILMQLGGVAKSMVIKLTASEKKSIMKKNDSKSTYL